MVSRRFKWIVCCLLVCGTLAAASPYRLVMVEGTSMQPTFHNRQLVLMDRAPVPASQIRRGDVVVFRHCGETYIKRVHAVQGDTIDICRSFNGYTGLLGECPFQRDTIQRCARRRYCGVQVYHHVIPRDTIFVVGDNRNCSVDSRSFGAVPSDQIVGRIVSGTQAAAAMRNKVIRVAFALRAHGAGIS